MLLVLPTLSGLIEGFGLSVLIAGAIWALSNICVLVFVGYLGWRIFRAILSFATSSVGQETIGSVVSARYGGLNEERINRFHQSRLRGDGMYEDAYGGEYRG